MARSSAYAARTSCTPIPPATSTAPIRAARIAVIPIPIPATAAISSIARITAVSVGGPGRTASAVPPCAAVGPGAAIAADLCWSAARGVCPICPIATGGTRSAIAAISATVAVSSTQGLTAIAAISTIATGRGAAAIYPRHHGICAGIPQATLATIPAIAAVTKNRAAPTAVAAISTIAAGVKGIAIGPVAACAAIPAVAISPPISAIATRFSGCCRVSAVPTASAIAAKGAGNTRLTCSSTGAASSARPFQAGRAPRSCTARIAAVAACSAVWFGAIAVPPISPVARSPRVPARAAITARAVYTRTGVSARAALPASPAIGAVAAIATSRCRIHA